MGGSGQASGQVGGSRKRVDAVIAGFANRTMAIDVANVEVKAAGAAFSRNGDGSFKVDGHLENKEKEKVIKYKALCEAENLDFKPLVTSTWGGFGARCAEVIGPMADVLMEREMLTKARATKLIKRALQTSAMVQIALNGMSLLEETQDEENAAAVTAALGKEGNVERVLQNPGGLGVPTVQTAEQMQAASGLALPGLQPSGVGPGAAQQVPTAASDAMGQ
jgi:hypothetical protein